MGAHRKSREYQVQEQVQLAGGRYTKQADGPVDGVVGLAEIWTDGQGREWMPTLGFQEGVTGPAFERVQP